MPEQCERCPAPAVTRWWHAETKAELWMCGHHSREHGPALIAGGWLACGGLVAQTPA